MSLVDDLLIILTSYSGGYRLMRARMRGSTWHPKIKVRARGSSDNTMRVTLSRLRNRGLVERKKGIWNITELGKSYLVEKGLLWKNANVRQTPKGMIIAFDVPETYKSKRDWLRTSLCGLGFEMLQKSVWFGPAPLPPEFIDTLNRLNILPYMKFFKARESDVV